MTRIEMDTVTRLITEHEGGPHSPYRGVWDITSLTAEHLAELRSHHEREFVYARDYDVLLAEVDRLTLALAEAREARDEAQRQIDAVIDVFEEHSRCLYLDGHAQPNTRENAAALANKCQEHEVAQQQRAHRAESSLHALREAVKGLPSPCRRFTPFQEAERWYCNWCGAEWLATATHEHPKNHCVWPTVHAAEALETKE